MVVRDGSGYAPRVGSGLTPFAVDWATGKTPRRSLAEDFDQPEFDSKMWHRPEWLARHNPYIAVAPEHGQLHLSGISRPAGTAHQYVGIISSNYRETDVVLAVNVRVRSEFDRGGRIQDFVHLIMTVKG